MANKKGINQDFKLGVYDSVKGFTKEQIIDIIDKDLFFRIGITSRGYYTSKDSNFLLEKDFKLKKNLKIISDYFTNHTDRDVDIQIGWNDKVSILFDANRINGKQVKDILERNEK